MSNSSDGHAVVVYRLNNEIREWGIGCNVLKDSEDTLRRHVRRWIPDAEFLGCRVTRVSDGVVQHDSILPTWTERED